jgi:hypothetical protein
LTSRKYRQGESFRVPVYRDYVKIIAVLLKTSISLRTIVNYEMLCLFWVNFTSQKWVMVHYYHWKKRQISKMRAWLAEIWDLLIRFLKITEPIWIFSNVCVCCWSWSGPCLFATVQVKKSSEDSKICMRSSIFKFAWADCQSMISSAAWLYDVVWTFFWRIF